MLATYYLGHTICWPHIILAIYYVGHILSWSHIILATYYFDHILCWPHYLGHILSWPHIILVIYYVGRILSWPHTILTTYIGHILSCSHIILATLLQQHIILVTYYIGQILLSWSHYIGHIFTILATLYWTHIYYLGHINYTDTQAHASDRLDQVVLSAADSHKVMQYSLYHEGPVKNLKLQMNAQTQ